jgi:hypothetical protein
LQNFVENFTFNYTKVQRNYFAAVEKHENFVSGGKKFHKFLPAEAQKKK